MGTGWLYVLSAFLVTAYLFLFVRVLWRVGDEGLFLNGAALVAGGAVPYRDFFETAGPGSFYWLALFFRIFGTSIVVARALVVATAAASALLLLWLTRRFDRSGSQFLPATSYLVLGFTIWPVTNHHWDSNLAALLCVAAVVRWQENGRVWRLVAAGVLAGITSCFLQQKGLLMLAAVCAVVITSRRGELRGPVRQVAWVVVGFVAVIGTVVVFFALESALGDLVYATVLWPLANYTEVNSVPFGYGLWQWLITGMWRRPLELLLPSPAAGVLTGVLAFPYVLLMALPILCLGLAILARRRSGAPLSASMDLQALWMTGGALWLSELHRRDIVHLIYGSPLLMVLLLALWSSWCGNRRRLRVSVLTIVTCSVVAVGVFHGLLATAARTAIDTRRGRLYAFRDDEALRFLQTHLQRGDKVFVYPYYPMYYFLADVVNPTRYSILMYDINTPAQFERALDALDRQRVQWVLWDSQIYGSGLRTWFPNYSSPDKNDMRLERYLERNYDVLETANGFRILRRRVPDPGGGADDGTGRATH